MRNILLILSGLGFAISPASARNVEADALNIGATIGPSFKIGTTLGGSSAYGTLGITGDYALDSAWSLAGDVTVGLANTVPLRLHLGTRWRKGNLDLPLSPYLRVDCTLARLYDVLGADLTAMGGRLGAGVDYFVTASITAGLLVGVDLLGTFGDRPAFTGLVDLLLYATYSF